MELNDDGFSTTVCFRESISRVLSFVARNRTIIRNRVLLRVYAIVYYTMHHSCIARKYLFGLTVHAPSAAGKQSVNADASLLSLYSVVQSIRFLFLLFFGMRVDARKTYLLFQWRFFAGWPQPRQVCPGAKSLFIQVSGVCI